MTSVSQAVDRRRLSADATIRPEVQGPPEVVAPKPYKGLNSFQVEDADLFFGRDHEAEQLVAKILSSRLTILHAQSGAGKTSLLNAKVIPGLEEMGWSAARVIPQIDPVRAVTTTTLLHVLPPPEAERLAIQNAWEQLDTPHTLGELLKAFLTLPEQDPVRRSLISPIMWESKLPGDPSGVRVYPWFNRLLRSTIELNEFSQHLSAFRAVAALPALPPLQPSTPVANLVQTLNELNGSYADVLAGFAPHQRDFDEFFRLLVDQYGAHMPHLAVVVLFDQAEELFTLFVEQPGQTLDWRLKWEFFEQLEALVGRPGADRKKATLPVRFVLSLRSEYIAQLDPIRSFTWDLDSCSYHLGMLGTADAMTAITQPADRFGYAYTDACYEEIVKDLAREERYIEPAQLQIVCDKLWHVHGSLLAVAPSTKTADGQKPRLTIATLERLGGAKGILAKFLEESLGTLNHETRLEIVEMLERLVTRSGTRNAISRDELVNQRFRNVERRAVLLQRLVDRRIIREERRLGGLLCEITHEFLITPLLTLVKEFSVDAEYARFRWALGTVQQLAETGQDPRSVGALRVAEFLAIHDNHTRLVIDGWLREVMLRSALTLAHHLPDIRRPRDIIAFWVQELEKQEAA